MWVPWKQEPWVFISSVWKQPAWDLVPSRCFINIGYEDAWVTNYSCGFPEWPLPIGLFQMWGTPWWQNTFMELIFFFLFPIGHLHSESRNSFPAYRNHSHGKLRLLLVERNNIKMYEISSMAPVLPAKGTVKFRETPPPPPPTEAASPLECSSVPSETAVLGGAGIITHSNGFATA